MKLLLVLFVFTVAGLTFAKHPVVGCGPGTMIIKPDSKDKLMLIFAATTNATSGFQTFGITTGTFDCGTKPLLADAQETRQIRINFIEANKNALANDIARGNGETISTVCELYTCTNLHEAGKTLQRNYRNIFSKNATASDINNNIENALKTI